MSSQLETVFLLVAVAIVLIVRANFVATRSADFDFFGHRYFGSQLHLSKASFFGPVSLGVPNSAPYFAPFLWDYVARAIPYKFSLRYQHLLNPFAELIFLSFFYWLLVSLGASFELAVVGVLIYLLTPSSFSNVLSNGPRLSSFTPRLTSELLVSGFFLLVILEAYDANWLGLIAMLLVAVAVLTISRFGTQAILFVSTAVALLFQNWIPLGVVFLAGFLLWLLFRKAFTQSLLTQAGQLLEMSRRLRQSFNRRGLTSGKSNFKTVRRVLLSHPIAQLVFLFPVVPASILVSLLNNDTATLDSPVLHIALSALLVFVVISIRPLKFLGHPERYLLHLHPVFILLLLRASEISGWKALSTCLVFYGAVVLATESGIILRTKTIIKKNERHSQRLLSYLKTLCPATVIAMSPYHVGPGVWRVLLETDHQVIFDLVNPSLSGLPGRLFESYPKLNLSRIDELRELFEASILILDNEEAGAWEKQFPGEFEEWSEVELELDGLRVFIAR